MSSVVPEAPLNIGSSNECMLSYQIIKGKKVTTKEC